MDLSEKILIAGANGMVGSAIYEQLKAEGYKNIVCLTRKDVDLRNQLETEKMFEQIKPAYVFLAAAKVGGILANNTYKAEFIYDNLMIAANVINASKIFEVKKLLNLGSSCIYPKFAPQPMKEEQLLTGALEPTNEPYAIAKIAAIKLCRYFNEQYGTNFISVMPTNLYGGNDNYNLETSHVLPALIRKFLLGKKLAEGDYDWIMRDFELYSVGFGFDVSKEILNSQAIESILQKIGIDKGKITLWGTGNALREFMHVKDLAKACIFLMKNYSFFEIGEFVNIGTGQEISIKQLAEIIKELVEYDGEIIFDSSKPDGTPRKLLDISRIKNLGWEPKIELRNGIKMTIEKYIDEH